MDGSHVRIYCRTHLGRDNLCCDRGSADVILGSSGSCSYGTRRILQRPGTAKENNVLKQNTSFC